MPVPPRKGKVRKKGWDQIQELSNILKKQYGINVLNALKRISSVQQKKLNRKDRLDTIGSAYIPSKKLLNLCKKNTLPREVYLLDDVITTGSTVESCCRVLKNAGISKVFVLSLFIVD